MPRINAGEQFGQEVVSGGGMSRIQMAEAPRALQEVGRQIEVKGLQAEAAAAHEIKVQQQELAQARAAADSARASSVLVNTRYALAYLSRSIGQEIQDGRLPKADAPKAWKARSAELIAAGAGEAPETHRAIVQQDLTGLAGRLDSQVNDSVRARDQQDTRADLDSTLEALQRNAVGDYAKAREQALGALATLGPAAGMRPDEIQKAGQNWVEGAAYTRAFTAVTQAKTDNRALSAVEKALNANGDIDPQAKAQLLANVDNYRAQNEARALRQAQQAEISAARGEREAAKAWDVLSGWAMAGKVPNAEAAAGLLSKLDPARLQAYRAMAADVGARTTAAMLPLQTQRAQLDGLIAQRATSGTSQALEQEIERRQQVLKSAEKEYGEDALRAAASRGVIDTIDPIDVSSLDKLGASLGRRIDQAQTVSTRTRGAVSPLLPEEADRVAGMLRALAPSAQGGAISRLATVLPPGMMGAIAKQIDAKDKPLALAMSVGTQQTTQGRAVAELILKGAQAVKDKSVKEDAGAEVGVKAMIAKEVGDSVPPAARENVIAAARLIYLGKAAEGDSIDAANAVRLAIGGKFETHQGRRVPVPAGVDLPQALQSYPRASIDRQAKDGAVYLERGRTMGVPEFLAGLPGMQLEPVGMGRYMVRAGGSLAMTADRQPIVLEVGQ